MTDAGNASFAGALFRHRRVVYLAAAALAALGLASLGRLSSGIYPDVAFPRISVIAEAGEDSVENVELAVTRPLEQAVSIVQGIRRVRAKTIRGASELSIDFEASTDMRQALQDVRARLSQIQGQLPQELRLTVERQMPSLFPVISFTVSLAEGSRGRLGTTADLNDWALLEVKPRLARLRDVFLVTVQSADVHEVQVEVQPDALAARGLSVADVADALGRANQVGAVGRLDRDGKWYQVLVTGQFRSLQDVAEVALPLGPGRAVRLGDVATVREGTADRTSVVSGNGQESVVVVNVFMRAGGRVTELSRNVEATLAEVKQLSPPAVRVTPVYDQADLVNASLAGVRDAILTGGVLSVVILLLFLRDLRATLVAAPSIPLAIVGTFAFMDWFGLTLNLMSLGGIAIAIGLVVDDAIVVVEAIARHLHEGKERVLAVDLAVKEVAGAVVGSSLTTVVVFAPLVLLEGVSGQFMKALSLTLSIAILLSLLISLTLIPVLALGRFGPRSHQGGGPPRLASLHDRAARGLFRRKKLGWLGLAAVLALAWRAGDPRGHVGFLPEMDEGAFVIDTRSPVGTALPVTDGYVREIEAVLAATPEVRAFSRRTGQELGLFATEPWKGDILVSLKPRGKDRKQTGDQLQDELRDKLSKQVPQLELEFTQLMQDTLNDMSGDPAPIEVKFFGRDHRLLADAVERARRRLLQVRGLVDLSHGMSFGSPELFFRVEPGAAARRGLQAADVEKEATAALRGTIATTMRWGERLVPVRVRWPDAARFDERWIEGIPVSSKDARAPIGVLARREERSNPNELERENQQPVATLTARLSNLDLGEATAAVQATLADLPLPEGSRIELGGQSRSQAEMFASLRVVLVLGVSLVLALLVAQFRSFGRAAVIFLALPFSQVGGLLALRLAGIPVNLSSFMGLIMLVGLVVKNGILLVDHADRLREEGVPLEEALVRAGNVRLRPILMTSLTAIAGLVPLVLNLGSGAELQRPLAVAVIGGLTLSTVLTLAVVPLGTLVLARRVPEA